jgi:hypothetical protein
MLNHLVDFRGSYPWTPCDAFLSMTSQKQIDANRRNAQKSTGPRTAAGKSIISTNAYKHGIFAESPTIVGENTTAFATLKQSLLDRFQPATPEEEILVATITRNAWLLERFSNVEVQVWDLRLNRLDEDNEAHMLNPLAIAHDSVYHCLGKLQCRIDSADRAYRRNLECLLKLQASHQTTLVPPAILLPVPCAGPASVPKPEAISQPQSPESVTPENGFVPANSTSTPPAPPAPARPRVTFPILGPPREAA